MASLALSSLFIVMTFLAFTGAKACVVQGDHYTQPHVIFLLADDLGFNDMGWNNEEVNSPYLNKMAKSGIILDRNYVTPVCSPSRGSLQTGKYAFRLGMQHAVIETMTPDCLDLSETLIGEEMRDLGYATHMLGKWHLGFCNWDCTPTERGYDTFYGYYNGYVDHISHEIDDWYDWRDQKEPVTSNAGTYATDLIAERASKIIKMDDGSKPLFMMVGLATTHTPLQLPDGTTYVSGDGERNIFLRMVIAMDNAVSVIVDALKDKGYYDNSVIIFSSDNGGEMGGSSNYPLRGTKASVYEGGTRVAGMVHSPLQTVSGIISDEMFSIVDWYPTIVELAGGCPDESQMDGLSQVDMIMNGGASRRDEVVYNIDPYMPPNYGREAIRIGDLKLIVGFPGMYDGWEQDGNVGLSYDLDLLGVLHESKRKKRSSYVVDYEAIAQYAKAAQEHVYLFNVMEDPEERINLAADNHDIVKSMNSRLKELMAQAAPLNPEASEVVPEAKAEEYNGIWTPGWC